MELRAQLFMVAASRIRPLVLGFRGGCPLSSEGPTHNSPCGERGGTQ